MPGGKMSPKPAQHRDFHVLIAAAGSGARFGTSKQPKQYTLLSGKPLIRHSIETFLSLPGCKSVRVIINPDHADLYQNSVNDLNLPPPLHGGNERNESVFKALKSSSEIKDEELILIHDAARPCVKAEDIARLLASFDHAKAASLATPIAATLRRNKETQAGEIVDRTNLSALQTPQAFYKGDLLKAHENAPAGQAATDDTMLISAIGIPVELVPGSPENIKITYPEDLIMAEKLLNAARVTLTGMGFDVHAFDTDKPGPVRLCGIDIEHAHKLKGHSDADVGLHALTDAIYGAIGEGDIGRHFPPSNNDFKDMDSAIFLKHAVELAQAKGAKLLSADLTLICERPKITPHAEAMRTRVAEITGMNPKRINIKATTTEQLGFTGRSEGIAAQAIISVSIPENA